MIFHLEDVTKYVAEEFIADDVNRQNLKEKRRRLDREKEKILDEDTIVVWMRNRYNQRVLRSISKQDFDAESMVIMTEYPDDEIIPRATKDEMLKGKKEDFSEKITEEDIMKDFGFEQKKIITEFNSNTRF